MARPTQGRKVSSRLPRLPNGVRDLAVEQPAGIAVRIASTAMNQPRRHMPLFRRRREAVRVAACVWARAVCGAAGHAVDYCGLSGLPKSAPLSGTGDFILPEDRIGPK